MALSHKRLSPPFGGVGGFFFPSPSPNRPQIAAGITAAPLLREISMDSADGTLLRSYYRDMIGALPPQAPPAATPPRIGASRMGDLPPFTQLKHPASVMHGRGKRTARMPSPATSQSSWMRTAMVISPIQPSPATMAKVEKAHEFLQRRWNARQQQAELHLQK